MPNGKPGDHPLTDIVGHGLEVYSPLADSLVREIVKLGGEDEIADMLLTEYNTFFDPDVVKLERVLTGIRDRLLEQARSRGWEV
ncbi:MAG: hypothetical protein ACE5JU_09860 [Candidatus Binatia bacterium]